MIMTMEVKLKEYDNQRLSLGQLVSYLRSNLQIKGPANESFVDADPELSFAEEVRRNLDTYTILSKSTHSKSLSINLNGIFVSHNSINTNYHCEHLLQFNVEQISTNVSNTLQQKHLYFSSPHESEKFLRLFELIGTDAFHLILDNDMKELYFPESTDPSFSLKTDTTERCLTLGVLPTCALEVNPESITFTPKVLKCLHRIQHLLDNGFSVEAYICGKKFFCRFGSHVYLKNIIIGGYFLLATESRDACNSDVERRHCSKLNELSMSLVSLNVREELECDNCQHVFLRKGGPDIKISLSFWELLLKRNPFLSQQISYGSFHLNDYVAIWEIIGKAQISGIREEISTYLQEVWSTVQQENIYIFRQQSLLPFSDVKKCCEYIECTIQRNDGCSHSNVNPIDILQDLCSEIEHSHGNQRKEWINEIQEKCIIEKVFSLLFNVEDGSDQKYCRLLIDFLRLTEMYHNPFRQRALNFVLDWVIQKENTLSCSNHTDTEDPFLANALSLLIEMKQTEAKVNGNFCQYLILLKCMNELNIDYGNEEISFLTRPSWRHLKLFLTEMIGPFADVKNDFETQRKLLSEFLDNTVDGDKMINIIHKVVSATPLGVEPNIRAILFNEKNLTGKKLKKVQCIKADAKLIGWSYFEKTKLDSLQSDKLFHRRNVNPVKHFDLPETVTYVLKSLGLTEKYPGQISIQSVQSHVNCIFDKPDTLLDVPWTILREIIAVNYSFREKVLEEFYQDYSKMETEEDLLRDLSSDSSDSIGIHESSHLPKKDIHLHPSDVLLAVYLCSDMHLQRILANKIASCQLALPFVHPTLEDGRLAALTWPLHEITIGTDGIYAWSSKLPIVSFIRIGKCEFCSKSKLINEVLRDQNEEHATFFHRDCPLGQQPRRISNGIIELSWYTPSKHSKMKSFSILNLRGDGDIMKMQMNLIGEISDILVLFIDFLNFDNPAFFNSLNNIYRKKAKIIIVTNIKDTVKARRIVQTHINHTDMHQAKSKLISLFDSKANSYHNASEQKNKLIKELYCALNDITDCKGLESAIHGIDVQVMIDENGFYCKTGKQMALRVYETLVKFGSKSNILPLQGEEFWKKLSKVEKERNRVGNVSSYDTSEKDFKKIERIKEAQFHMCLSNSDFAVFIENLYISFEDPFVLPFFISWLKQFLDKSSRNLQRHNQDKFREALLKYQVEKTENNASMLDRAEKELTNTLIGLEHCLREVGQVFEAFMNMQELKKVIMEETSMIICQKLPRTVAKLLLHGHPFELMDGDAANVPLKWIKAVFKEIRNEIGDAKVFVVSVLGIQSSGKSTLLNSMFGLQLAVSAGRCTRGIYTQLVPVKSERLALDFDYVMVVDTEGLKAPELSEGKVHHDNELATLVIGMADFNIINIKGETIADLENVLQIVVHALIRLKQANKNLLLKQSCLLVHQNVSAQDVEKHKQHGNHKTIQNLDQITREVAITEHLSADFKTFSDVIKFDPMTCIEYVPDLWHGTPPMAPVNKNYSSKITGIAKKIFSESSGEKYLTISDTLDHFESLWKGILKEDFVFSFRNCLELKAYSILETKYQSLAWRLEETQLTWFDENVRTSLNKCSSDNDLNQSVKLLVKEFSVSIEKTKVEVQDELRHFMEKSALKEQMVQWREAKILDIHYLVSDIKECFKEKTENIKTHNKIELSSKNLLHEKEKQINEQARQFAQSFKDTKPSDEDLRLQFEPMWEQWLLEIEKQIPNQSDDDKINNLITTMENTLDQEFSQHSALLRKGLDVQNWDCSIHQTMLQGSFNLVPKSHLSMISIIKKVTTNVEKYADEVKADIDKSLHQIDEYILNLGRQDIECSDSEFKRILKILNEFYSDHNSKNTKYKLNHELQIDLALHVSRFVFGRFKKLNLKFYESKSVKARLKLYKPKAFEFFISTVNEKANEIVAANIISADLEERIFEKVMLKVAIILKASIHTSFSFRKFHLIKDILEYLCRKLDFQEYISYIESPKDYSLRWLRRYVDKKFFSKETTNNIYIWAKNELQSITFKIEYSLKTLLKNDEKSSMTEWIAKFKDEIGCYVSLKENAFFHVMDQNVADIAHFNECVIESLRDTVTRLHTKFMTTNWETVQWIDVSPVDGIFDTIWGCKEVCPWCKEPCQHSVGHQVKHRCIQHRPIGVGGIHEKDSRKLVIESCNFKVQSTINLTCGSWCGCSKTCLMSHPYKEYNKYMPNWDIVPQVDMRSSSYWTWFVCTFQKDLAECYHVHEPDIPESWKKVTQREAIESLNKYLT